MLPSIIRGAAARFPDRPAYVTADNDAVTYAELDARSDGVARGLSAAGISEGDVVALHVDPGDEPAIKQALGAFAG